MFIRYLPEHRRGLDSTFVPHVPPGSCETWDGVNLNKIRRSCPLSHVSRVKIDEGENSQRARAPPFSHSENSPEVSRLGTQTAA
jgi:hypothetical protein